MPWREVAAVALSVWMLNLIAQDGESHWLEGVQLLALYIILGLAFSVLPATSLWLHWRAPAVCSPGDASHEPLTAILKLCIVNTVAPVSRGRE